MLSTKLLSPKVQSLVSTWLGSVPNPDKNQIQVYLDMVTTHPVAAAANDLRILLGISMLREYSHSDEKIQQEVRKSISTMSGSWRNTIASMMTYLAFGRSFSEVAHDVIKKKASLKAIQTLDPRYYYFEGSLGEITRIHYLGMTDIYIPYENGIHLINKPYLALGGNPYGIPICKAAYPFVELSKLIMASVSVAGERQATKLLLGQTDTAKNDVTMPDPETGQPIIDPLTGQAKLFNQGYVLSKSLEQVQNNSYLVTDIADQITAIAHETDGSFFINILSFLESMILLSWLVPRTVTGTGANSSGDSNLNEGHRETLRLINRSEMEMIGEALIEQAIKPMLLFNYGEMEDYGVFPVAQEDSADTVQLLAVLTGAVERGSFSASDLKVINRMRELAGIEQIEPSDFIPPELKNQPQISQDNNKNLDSNGLNEEGKSDSKSASFFLK
jgi:hypothetical protein